MSLRIPPIDQRSFEDLVDEARQRIRKDCPTDRRGTFHVSARVEPGKIVRIWSPRDRRFGPPLVVR